MVELINFMNYMKPQIKLYKYYIKGKETPIKMEADSRSQADDMLVRLVEKTGVKITQNDIEDLRIETLVLGQSSKIKDGKKMIWVGKEKSQTGWMEEGEFKIIARNNKKQNE